jgi:hypothetical protein
MSVFVLVGLHKRLSQERFSLLRQASFGVSPPHHRKGKPQSIFIISFQNKGTRASEQCLVIIHWPIFVVSTM